MIVYDTEPLVVCPAIPGSEGIIDGLIVAAIHMDIQKFSAQMGITENSNEWGNLYVRMMVDGQDTEWPEFTPNVAVIRDKEVEFKAQLEPDTQEMMRHFLPLMAGQIRNDPPFRVDDEQGHAFGNVIDPLQTQWFTEGVGVKGIMLKAQSVTGTDRTPYGVFALLQHQANHGASYRVYVVRPSPDFQPFQMAPYFKSDHSHGVWNWGYKMHVLQTGQCPDGNVLSAKKPVTCSQDWQEKMTPIGEVFFRRPCSAIKPGRCSSVRSGGRKQR